jgi:hypothetical protein
MGLIREAKIGLWVLSLARRINATEKTGDPTHVLDHRALTTVGKLLSSPSSAKDADVLVTVGIFHWIRFMALPGGEGERDLRIATEMIREVYQIDPDKVPAKLRHLLEDRELADGESDQEMPISTAAFTEVQINSDSLAQRSRKQFDRTDADDRTAIRLIAPTPCTAGGGSRGSRN